MGAGLVVWVNLGNLEEGFVLREVVSRLQSVGVTLVYSRRMRSKGDKKRHSS